MCMVRSPKSIGGAVVSILGDAPYKIGDLLRSAFGIALAPQSVIQLTALLGRIVIRWSMLRIILYQGVVISCIEKLRSTKNNASQVSFLALVIVIWTKRIGNIHNWSTYIVFMEFTADPIPAWSVCTKYNDGVRQGKWHWYSGDMCVSNGIVDGQGKVGACIRVCILKFDVTVHIWINGPLEFSGFPVLFNEREVKRPRAISCN